MIQGTVRKKHRWKFTLKPGSLFLLAPVIVAAVIITHCMPGHEEPVTKAAAPLIETTYIACADEAKPKAVARYASITMTDGELRELAEVIYHEARGESPEGQQAVAEVVFNRVLAKNFPDTVYQVIHEGEGKKVVQFSSVRLLGTAEPMKEQFDAINGALYGEIILPADVVYFSQKGESDRVWGKIGAHVFCYQYAWD